MNELKLLRQNIDLLDDQILNLLNDRMEIVQKIGALKKDQNMSIYRPDREQEILQRLTSINTGVLNTPSIEAIFREIFSVSRHFEFPERVAYLGPEGSFTHQAAESRYGAVSSYLSLPTIQSVFEAVDTERVKYGVVPIENNQEGTVQETIDLLGKKNVKIIAEMALPIHFAFASTVAIEEISVIFSRDIAFGQCSNFIKNYLPNTIKTVPVNSTSRACEMAMETPNSGAITSAIAAHQRGLPILFNNIEDSADNHTRFLILSKKFDQLPTGQDKTSIIATLPNVPGSLADFLQRFHEANINLCKVESRPAKQGHSFHYIFFIDFEGHYNDESVQMLLKPLSNQIKWLGSYLKTC